MNKIAVISAVILSMFFMLGNARTPIAECVVSKADTAGSKQMKDLFIKMPLELMPMLSESSRWDLIDFCESNMRAVVDNSWDGRTTLTKLTSNYLLLKEDTDGRVCTEMVLLPGGKDSVICVNRTVSIPQKDSKLQFYTTSWKPLDASKFVILPKARDFKSGATEGISKSGSIESLGISIDATEAAVKLRITRNEDTGFTLDDSDTTPVIDEVCYLWSKGRFVKQ